MENPVILCDLDEVFADFRGAALRVHGWTRDDYDQKHVPGGWDMCIPLGLSADEFWQPIHELGERFWLGLQPLPWASSLRVVLDRFGLDWYIMTSPSRDPYCYVGKIKWMKRYFGQRFDRFIITTYKHLLAGASKILVDDREETVCRFRKHGGLGIVFPSDLNSLHHHRHRAVAYVEEQLKELTNVYAS